MSETSSPVTNLKYGIEMVCRVWGYARSTFYHARKPRAAPPRKRGPAPMISDGQILGAIKHDIETSHFRGEGHRKIHARIRRRQGLCVGRNRVLKLMKANKLLSPYRVQVGSPKRHDGRITTDVPNDMWATDATKIFTLEDGYVWFFGVIEHWNAECLGWHLSRKGDRFAAIEAMTNTLERTLGKAAPDIARGVRLRVDHGSQFLSEGFIRYAHSRGLSISKAFVREPETNGVVERFHRTFKEQIIHGQVYHSIVDLKLAVDAFIATYNAHWLLEKLDYRSPIEARKDYEAQFAEPNHLISTLLPEVEERARLLSSGSLQDANSTIGACHVGRK